MNQNQAAENAAAQHHIEVARRRHRRRKIRWQVGELFFSVPVFVLAAITYASRPTDSKKQLDTALVMILICFILSSIRAVRHLYGWVKSIDYVENRGCSDIAIAVLSFVSLIIGLEHLGGTDGRYRDLAIATLSMAAASFIWPLILLFGAVGFYCVCCPIICCLHCCGIEPDGWLRRMAVKGASEEFPAYEYAGPMVSESQTENHRTSDSKIELVKTDCAICLMDYESGDKVRQTPCNHFYHDICFLNWLKVSHTCPLCRFDLTGEDDDEIEG